MSLDVSRPEGNWLKSILHNNNNTILIIPLADNLYTTICIIS